MMRSGREREVEGKFKCWKQGGGVSWRSGEVAVRCKCARRDEERGRKGSG